MFGPSKPTHGYTTLNRNDSDLSVAARTSRQSTGITEIEQGRRLRSSPIMVSKNEELAHWSVYCPLFQLHGRKWCLPSSQNTKLWIKLTSPTTDHYLLSLVSRLYSKNCTFPAYPHSSPRCLSFPYTNLASTTNTKTSRVLLTVAEQY